MAAQDGIALLREDHRAVKVLFREFFAAGDRAHTTRRRLADRIITELSIHAGIEETVLYPRARAVVPKLEDDVLEALEEHHVAKLLCAELQGMSPRDERFVAKMSVLRESVTHHIGEEESELFPKLRKLFSRDELLTMAEDMRAARRVVPTRPHPEAPDEPPGNVAASLVARPLDTVVETVGAVVDRTKRAVAGAARD